MAAGRFVWVLAGYCAQLLVQQVHCQGNDEGIIKGPIAPLEHMQQTSKDIFSSNMRTDMWLKSHNFKNKLK